MEPVLGQLITTEARRDAIHVAMVPLIATETLRRADFFVLEEGSITKARLAKNFSEAIGYVDPLLQENVLKGEKFWGYLKPNQVTGMRHHFTHPSFPEELENQAYLEINSEPKSKGHSTPFTDILVSKILESDTPDYDKIFHERWLKKFCANYYLDFDNVIYEATHNGEICAGEEWGYDDEYSVEEFWEHLEGYTGKKYSEAERDEVCWRCAC